MVACLVGPGPEEDILLLDFDFLVSSFGESLFALYTKRCLTQQQDEWKVETALSQPDMSLAATYVQHGRNRETLQRPGEMVCVRRIGHLRRPIAEISHLVGT